MSDTLLYDNGFKILSLLFWPIMWFKWQFPPTEPNYLIIVLSFAIYLALAIIYLILLTYSYFKYRNIEKIIYSYRVSTLLAFILSLTCFLLFPKSIFLLGVKMLFLGLYLYISCLKVYKYHKDEGVVGILSVLLLIIITVLY